MTPLIPAYAYLRVSTDKQTVENQRHQISEYARNRGYVVLDWFKDPETHGYVPPMERDGFSNMIALLRDETLDPRPKYVLIYELSRLGRTFWDEMESIKIVEDLAPVISTSPKEEFLQIQDSGIRKLLLAWGAYFAERERELIGQRTKDGIGRARAQGRHSGKVPLGYDQHVCARLGHGARPCELSGKLSLNKLGRVTLQLLLADPDLTADEVKRELGVSPYWRAYQLLTSVKRWRDPEKS